MNHGKESQNDKECDDVTGLSAKCMTSLISLVKRIGTGVCHDGHSHKTLVLVDSKVTNLKIQPNAINACVNGVWQLDRLKDEQSILLKVKDIGFSLFVSLSLSVLHNSIQSYSKILYFT